MSDQDRGPYTPQSDAPLAFDPRQSRGGGGGPAPMTLLVSAIILMALIVGILLFYRHGVRHPEQPATLVGAPVAETKSPPSAADTASSDQAAGLQVYKSEATPSSEGRTAAAAAPAFESGQEQPAPLPAARPVQPPPPIVNAPLRRADTLPPPPPKPVPRPAPKPVIVKQLPPIAQEPSVAAAPPSDSGNVAGSAFGPHSAQPAHAASSSAPATAHASTSPAKPASSAKPAAIAPTTKAEAKPDSAAKPKPKPATTTAEAKPAPEPKPAAAGGPVTVQIGAFSSADLAKQGWTDTAHILPGAMAGKSRKVETTVKDGKTFYRSYVGGFASKADAEAFCTSLRARSRPCMVK